jgi:hypothetical protein
MNHDEESVPEPESQKHQGPKANTQSRARSRSPVRGNGQGPERSRSRSRSRSFSAEAPNNTHGHPDCPNDIHCPDCVAAYAHEDGRHNERSQGCCGATLCVSRTGAFRRECIRLIPTRATSRTPGHWRFAGYRLAFHHTPRRAKTRTDPAGSRLQLTRCRSSSWRCLGSTTWGTTLTSTTGSWACPRSR